MQTYPNQSFFAFQAVNVDGQKVTLGDFKGKVLLIVNTASKCGFTPQYKSLQKLHETYQTWGFEVLAFPSNDFGNQEPGTHAEIKQFCRLKFNVTFPLFSKISVKGKDIHPLYQHLTKQTDFKGSIKWNFTKFLVDGNGQVVARYSPMKDPLSKDVTSKLKSLLEHEAGRTA